MALKSTGNPQKAFAETLKLARIGSRGDVAGITIFDRVIIQSSERGRERSPKRLDG